MSIPVGLVLVALADTWESKLAAVVYALGVTALFGVSAAYHRLAWTPVGRERMKRLDHSMIFVLIAGNLHAVLPAGAGRDHHARDPGGCGGAGRSSASAWPPGIADKHGIGFGLYLALGWLVVIALPQLRESLTPAQVVITIVGGVIYTVGAMGLAPRWPDPSPHLRLPRGLARHDRGGRRVLRRGRVLPRDRRHLTRRASTTRCRR